jgi:uncharacterized protein with HEPN domain
MIPPRDRERLLHILDACQTIAKRIEDADRARFSGDDVLQDATVRQLEIVGEAVSQLSEQTKAQAPSVPWKAIQGMRNRLIHGYWQVNWETVWDAAAIDLPALEKDIERLLRDAEQD